MTNILVNFSISRTIVRSLTSDYPVPPILCHGQVCGTETVASPTYCSSSEPSISLLKLWITMINAKKNQLIFII